MTAAYGALRALDVGADSGVYKGGAMTNHYTVDELLRIARRRYEQYSAAPPEGVLRVGGDLSTPDIIYHLAEKLRVLDGQNMTLVATVKRLQKERDVAVGKYEQYLDELRRA